MRSRLGVDNELIKKIKSYGHIYIQPIYIFFEIITRKSILYLNNIYKHNLILKSCTLVAVGSGSF